MFTKRKKIYSKLLFVLIATVVFCSILSISVSADNGYAPIDVYLTNIGEYKSTVDFTTYAIVNGDVYIDQNGNTAYEIAGFDFNQSFFDRYVEGYTSIENVVTMFFSQNQSFGVSYYYYDNGNITENYFEYSSNYPPHAYYWDNYVSAFRNSLEEQFGGWLNDINTLNSSVNSLQSEKNLLVQANERLVNENLVLDRENQSYIGQIANLNNNIDSLNEQIDSLESQLSVEYNNGYENGYLTGYNSGLEDADVFEIGLNSIFSAPSYALYSIFNFDIFGINVLSILLMVLSIILIAWLIKKFV